MPSFQECHHWSAAGQQRSMAYDNGRPGHAGQMSKDTVHLTNKKISHLANPEIPRMADVSGGFLLYTEYTQMDALERVKEAEMELTFKWRGYGISVKMLREQVRAAADRAKERVSGAPALEQRREVEREYLLASGNRYTAPTR